MWALSLLLLTSFAITLQPTRGFVSVPQPCHRVIQTDRLLGLFDGRHEGFQKGDDGKSAWWTVPTQTLIDKATDDPQRSISFSFLMTLCGAILVCLGMCSFLVLLVRSNFASSSLAIAQGPFLDSYHSLFGVLAYDTPLTFPILGTGGDILKCVTTYWVPPLFGLAGFLIGWLYIWLDEVFDVEEVVTPSKVLMGISYFTLQYWLSGVLYANGVDRSSILSIMSALAALGFYALDGTWSGFLTSTATALGGPLIEVGLISSLPPDIGYIYTDSGELGFFPLWILPVYFLGGPANGNLARAFWDVLGSEDSQVKTPQDRVIPCDVCNGTRVTSCPNCDGQVGCGLRTAKEFTN